jgi:hypothetical protein
VHSIGAEGSRPGSYADADVRAVFKAVNDALHRTHSLKEWLLLKIPLGAFENSRDPLDIKTDRVEAGS